MIISNFTAASQRTTAEPRTPTFITEPLDVTRQKCNVSAYSLGARLGPRGQGGAFVATEFSQSVALTIATLAGMGGAYFALRHWRINFSAGPTDESEEPHLYLLNLEAIKINRKLKHGISLRVTIK